MMKNHIFILLFIVAAMHKKSKVLGVEENKYLKTAFPKSERGGSIESRNLFYDRYRATKV